MVYKAVVSDWNGSAFRYPTDEELNKFIGYRILEHSRCKCASCREEPKIGKWWTRTKLFVAKKLTEKNLEAYKRGEKQLKDVYAAFNIALKGQKRTYIESLVNDFADENKGRVEGRILRPVRNAHNSGKKTAILSGSYDYAITRILGVAGYADVFDRIIANSLWTDGGKVTGLSLGIYGEKEKIMERQFFDKMRFDENGTLYIGNSEDDEPVAAILPPGNFIVPFLAADDFKQKMASKYKAFVPPDEVELDNYLKTR
jgi:phosphoserine phosphatase